MHIVVDAMGSDHHPTPDVLGAIAAAQEYNTKILLVGDEVVIKKVMDKHRYNHQKVEIVHAAEAITMEDKPATIGKSKPQSSMHVGMNLVRDGYADGFVTAGNTGAAHAIAMLYTLKRIPGIKRPALSAIFPINGHPIIFLDIGANADCKPEWLMQFAIMGSTYAENALGLMSPRVGLLSNGVEDGKGNQLVNEATLLLKNTPGLQYIGNIEPSDLPSGSVDVVISDGFTGNIFLKTFEASTRYLIGMIRSELQSNVLSTFGALLARPAFQRLRKRIDTTEVGGAPLLGVNGIVIIAHGNSNEIAIKHAVDQAQKAVRGNVIQAIQEKLMTSTIVQE